MLKKILIILLLVTSGLAINTSFKAEQMDMTLLKETKSLLQNDLVTFSNIDYSKSNWLSTGYVTLKMGNSTTYSLNLIDYKSLFEYYEQSNVSKVYIEFSLGSYYTGATIENWYSSNTSWDKTKKQLPITSDTTAIDLELWWNADNSSGGGPSSGLPGGIRLYSIDVVVEYIEPVMLYTIIDKVEGKVQFDQLPVTTTNPITGGEGSYGAAEFIFKNHDPILDKYYYDMMIDYNGYYKIEEITLPFMFSDYGKGFYFTYDDGGGLDRYVWFFENGEGTITTQPIITDSWIVWNLSDEQYQVTENKTIHGMPYAVGNGISSYNQLYVDFVVPWEIDDMLSITLDYSYRHHYLISLTGRDNFGKWQQVRGQTFLKDTYTTTAFPWWIDISGVYNMMFINNPNTFTGQYLSVEQIENITSSVDVDYRNDFVKFMKANGKSGVDYTAESIFMNNYKVFKVYIDTFDKFGSNGIQSRDIVIINTRVVHQGVKYTVFYPQIDIATQPEPNVPGFNPNDMTRSFLEAIWSFLMKFWGVLILIVSVVAFISLNTVIETFSGGKIKSKKVRFVIVISIMVIVFFIIKV